MTFIYTNLYPLEIYRMCENELPASRLSKFIVLQRHTDIQTDIQTDVLEIIDDAASRVVNNKRL